MLDRPADLSRIVKRCKTSETSGIGKALKLCWDAFGYCNKNQDDAVEALNACTDNADSLSGKFVDVEAEPSGVAKPGRRFYEVQWAH